MIFFSVTNKLSHAFYSLRPRVHEWVTKLLIGSDGAPKLLEFLYPGLYKFTAKFFFRVTPKPSQLFDYLPVLSLLILLPLITAAMAVISEIEEEMQQQEAPASSSPIPASTVDADEEVLASLLAKKGPLPFLEAAIDLVRRRSEFFKDEAAVGKVVKLVNAAKEKADAEESLKKRAASDVAKAEKRLKEEVQTIPVKTVAKDPETTESSSKLDEKDGLRSKHCSSIWHPCFHKLQSIIPSFSF